MFGENTDTSMSTSAAQFGATSRLPIILGLLFAILTVIACFSKGALDRTPFADERYYMLDAIVAIDHGLTALVDRPIDVNPHGNLMPSYPTWLAMTLSMGDTAVESARCAVAQPNGQRGPCQFDFSSVFWVQYLLAAFAIGLTVWFVARESKIPIAGGLAGIFLIGSGLPTLYANRYLTESLYLPLSIFFAVAFYFALKNRSLRLTALSGLLLGLAALTRASFLYAFLPVIAVTLFVSFDKAASTLKQRAIMAVVFMCLFIGTLSPWLWMNHKTYGSLMPQSTIVVLTTRIAYNDMNLVEYAAGWVYWLPDFGDALADHLFGEENVQRLQFEGKDSFYRDGHARVLAENQEAMAALLREANDEQNETARARDWLLREKIFGDLPKHTAVSLLLSWRGVFVGKYFGMVGLVAVLAVLLTTWGRRWRKLVIVVGAVPVFILGLQAFTTLNIPRYNVALLFPMAVSTGLMLSALFHWVVARLRGAASTN